MATKISISKGVAVSVYDDRFLPILKALGSVSIQRATEVEYDHVSQEWVATHISTGEIIARGTNRDQVIKDEVTWLEKNVI